MTAASAAVGVLVRACVTRTRRSSPSTSRAWTCGGERLAAVLHCASHVRVSQCLLDSTA
jgi:hypothetical protein